MMRKYYNIFFVFVFVLVAQLAAAQKVEVWKLANLQSAMTTAQQPTIINFWATFCKPCIAEMPHFQEVAAKYKDTGLRVIFVSLDVKEAFPEKMEAFLKKRNVKEPVYFLDESNADLFCPAVDSSWSGAIPATLFFNPKTGYRKFIEDEMSKNKLEEEVQRLIAER